MLVDLEDGSGTFQSVSSNKTLVFDNNNVTSNGLICDMFNGSNAVTTGTYSEVNSTINSTNCPNITLKYELNNNILLYLIHFLKTAEQSILKCNNETPLPPAVW